jgi:hypothetical protein
MSATLTISMPFFRAGCSHSRSFAGMGNSAGKHSAGAFAIARAVVCSAAPRLASIFQLGRTPDARAPLQSGMAVAALFSPFRICAFLARQIGVEAAHPEKSGLFKPNQPMTALAEWTPPARSFFNLASTGTKAADPPPQT